ncbi:MAG: AraC family transcriptional regulator [Chitinophagaceae bacterium]|nr:AraC family transcriptional regulator [Chitinophagaceae bacterium]
MQTQFLLPPPAIAAYVRYRVVLWEPRLPGDLVIPLIANGHPGIVFQSTGEKDELLLYGQTVQPVEFNADGHVTIIAYFLYPPVLKAFFGFDAKEMTDKRIDLSLLLPAGKMSLLQPLQDTAVLSERLQLMDEYVLKLAAGSHAGVHNAVAYATNAIQMAKGLISLQDLQRELCVTERTFQRMFESHVGLSPKMFRKICQFDAAFRQLNQGKFSRLADLAYEHDYADPSHFIRVFKEFTHRSPREYLKNMPDV